MSYEKELEFAQKLAREAGVIMNRYFRAEDIGKEWKEDSSPVTVADTLVNSMVIKKVKKQFPNYGVLGEEESYELDRDLIWVVDPIDGTAPFSLGIPTSTFLMALVDRKDGQPLVAVAYEPYLDHMYTAVKNQGSFLNGEPLKTSNAKNFERGYVSLYGQPTKTEKIDYKPGQLADELYYQKCRTFKLSSGAYTGVKVATGEFLALAMGNGLPWDSAAPALIVEEAGGIVTDLEGNKRRFDEVGLGIVIIANKTLLEEFLGMIKVKS